MKLIRLNINDRFRSLHSGFEIFFHAPIISPELDQFAPFCFAGLNGSGKSNVLEVLAAIFYHLECCSVKYLPDDFKKQFNPSKSSPNDFVIEYLIKPRSNNFQEEIIKYEHVKVTKQANEEPQFFLKDVLAKKPNTFIQIKESIQDYLPEMVVGYSSGENEILSLPFFKTRFIHYDEYIQSIANNERYIKEQDKKWNIQPESSLVYIDTSMSQAVMLANFLLQDEGVLKVFSDNMHVENITEFRLLIRDMDQVSLSDKGKESLTKEEQKIEFEKDKDKQYIRSITHNLQQAIDSLKACATSWYFDKKLNELVLDYKVTPATHIAFAEHFESSYDLFRTFQILLTLNLYQVKKNAKEQIYHSGSLYVNETIPQPPSDERVFRIKHFYLKKRFIDKPILSKNLSDGEHQFLHTMGICLMLQHRSALFLLDEPETHFNPEWRALFISTLKTCLEASGKGYHLLRDILITSHSPFIISDCLPNNVKIFRRNEKTKYEVVSETPDFNTFGASINIITNRIFGNRSSIAKHALNKLDEFRKKYNEGSEPEELKRQLDLEMGDSLEKHLFLKKILPKKE